MVIMDAEQLRRFRFRLGRQLEQSFQRLHHELAAFLDEELQPFEEGVVAQPVAQHTGTEEAVVAQPVAIEAIVAVANIGMDLARTALKDAEVGLQRVSED